MRPTPEQAAIINHVEGDAIVRAGPGTGKSATLVERTVYLLRERYALDEVLMLSFNREARQSLQLRLSERLGGLISPDQVPSHTFHSLALRIMRSAQPGYRAEGQLERVVQDAVRLLQTDEDILSRWRGSYSQIMIDEFQDVTEDYLALVNLLLDRQTSLMVIGDPAQTINAWQARGDPVEQSAIRDRFIRWEQDNPQAERFRLTTSFRSGPAILRAAERLIPQQMQAPSDAPDSAVYMLGSDNPAQEAQELVTGLRDALKLGGSTGVLVRLNSQLPVIREALTRAGLLDQVDLATVHSVKGQEWDNVFLMGAGADNWDRLIRSPGQLLDERRTFYTAITRPKQLLVVSWSGTPSRFVGEMTTDTAMQIPTAQDAERLDPIISADDIRNMSLGGHARFIDTPQGEQRVPAWIDSYERLQEIIIPHEPEHPLVSAWERTVQGLRETTALEDWALEVTSVRSPEGLLTAVTTESVPPGSRPYHLADQPMDFEWGKLFPYVTDPKTGRNPVNPRLITVRPGANSVLNSGYDPTTGDSLNPAIESMIRGLQERGINVHEISGTTIDRDFTLLVTDDPGGSSGLDWYLEGAAGERFPSAEREPRARDPGRRQKRDRLRMGSGISFAAENTSDDPRLATFGNDERGKTEIRWGIVDEILMPEFGFNGADGSLAFSESAARDIWRHITSDPWDRSVTALQLFQSITPQTVQYPEPDGRMASKRVSMIKGLGKIVPDDVWAQILEKHGLSPDTGIIASSDSLPNEKGNRRVHHGRLIPQRAHGHPFEWVHLQGGLTLTQAFRAMADPVDAMDLDFGFYSDLTMRALDQELGLGMEGMLMDPTEGGRWDVGSDMYQANLRAMGTIQERVQDNLLALQYGPAASPGAMDLLAGGVSARLRSELRSDLGSVGLTLPTVQSKLTSLEHTGVEPPEAGTARLRVREVPIGEREVFDTAFYVSPEDMNNEEVNKAFDGWDDDDLIRSLVGIEPDGTPVVNAHRPPVSPGGGWQFELDGDDFAYLVDHDIPLLRFRSNSVALQRIGSLAAADNATRSWSLPTVSDNQLDWVTDIARDLVSDSPRRRILAQSRFVLGSINHGNIGALTIPVAVVSRSGWLQGQDDLDTWRINLSDNIDVELNSTGDTAPTAAALNDRFVDAILNGYTAEDGVWRPVDSGLLQARQGYARAVLNHARQMVADQKIGPADFQALHYFLDRDGYERSYGLTPPARQIESALQPIQRYLEMQQAAKLQMADQMEAVYRSLANGPELWAIAPYLSLDYVRDIEAREGRPYPYAYIDDDVRRVAYRAFTEVRRIVRQNQDFVRNELDERGLNEAVRGHRRQINQIRSAWDQVMWAEVDRRMSAAFDEASRLPGYKEGMFLGAVRKEDILRRSRNNLLVTGRDEEKIIDTVRDRIYRTLKGGAEEVAFLGQGRTGMWISINYEPVNDTMGPWTIRTKSGDYQDVRTQRGKAAGRVRFHPEAAPNAGHWLGPYARVTAAPERDALHYLSLMGYEFEWVGDLERGKIGAFRVIQRGNVPAMTDVSNAQLAFWAKAHWLGFPDRGIPPIQLADMPEVYTPPQQWPDRVTASGYRVRWEDEMLQFEIPGEGGPMGTGENWLARTEWPEGTLPRSGVYPVPSELGRAYEVWMQDHADAPTVTDRDPPAPSEDVTPEVDPRPTPEPEPVGTRPPLTDEELAQALASREALSRDGAQARRNENAYQRRQGRHYNFADPDNRPSRRNSVGGREDSAAILDAVAGELSDLIGYFENTGQYQAPLPKMGTRSRGMPRPDVPAWMSSRQAIDNAFWYSPTLGHYVHFDEVMRAVLDYNRWRLGQVDLGANPKLRQAQTQSEAASLALWDVYVAAEERFIRNSELGYWDYQDIADPDTGELKPSWTHSRGQTMEIRGRVRPSAMLTIPVMPGLSVSLRARYSGRQRRQLERLLEGWAQELHGIMLFDGDIERTRSATPQQVKAEYQRVMEARRHNVAKYLAVQFYLQDRDRGVTVAGVKMQPGVVQAASEMIDLGKDLTEWTRYITRVLDTADGEMLEGLVRLGLRKGVENMQQGLGWHKNASAETNALRRTWSELQQSYLGRDVAEFRNIVQAAEGYMRQGKWIEAGAQATRLGNLWSVHEIRKRTRVYSSFTAGMDLAGRSLGRIIGVTGERVGPFRISGMLDVNTLFDDLEIQQMWSNIKQASKQAVYSYVDREHKDLSNRLQRAYRDALNKGEAYNLRMEALRSVVEDEWDVQVKKRTRSGLRWNVIIRADWYTMLTMGAGAAGLSRLARQNGVQIKKKWVVQRLDTDSLCVNNARQGWLDNDEPFHSGHSSPPAHPGCRCKLVTRLPKNNDPTLNGTIQRITKPRFVSPSRRRRRTWADPFSIPRLPRGVVPNIPDLPYGPTIPSARL